MSYRITSKLGLVGLACLVTNLVHAPDANACDPANWYWDTIPQSQETYPANAKPVLQGYGSFDQVTATIDGIDVIVSINPNLSYLFTGVAVDLDPPPQPGQTVVIHYPGEMGCDMEDPCPDQLTYTAGEPDGTTPAPATIDEVNVVRHNFENIDSCGGVDGGLAWWLNLFHEADPTSAPEYVRVTAYSSENTNSIWATKTLGGGAAKANISLELSSADTLPALPASLCFDIEVHDLSGHVSTLQEGICEVCHFRDEEPSDEGEPAWTDDDIYPGGACGAGPGTDSDSDSGTDTGGTDTDGTDTDGTDTDDTGETDTGGSDTDDTVNPGGSETDTGATETGSTTDGQNEEGCGCRSTQDAPTAWWLAILIGFGLRRRRSA